MISYLMSHLTDRSVPKDSVRLLGIYSEALLVFSSEVISFPPSATVAFPNVCSADPWDL